MKYKYDKMLKRKVSKDIIIYELASFLGLCIKHDSCKYRNLPKIRKIIKIVRKKRDFKGCLCGG